MSAPDLPQEFTFYRELVRDARRAGRTPFPEIGDETRRRAWITRLQQDGVLDQLRDELAHEPPVEPLPFAAGEDFRRNGDRVRYETSLQRQRAHFTRAEVAAHLGLDVGERLDNLAWLQCETTDWRLPAHRWNCPFIDLDVAMTGYRLAMWLVLFGDRMDSAVRRRVRDELERRVWDPGAFKEHLWHHNIANWNAVCHGGVTLSALMACPDDDLTAELLRLAVVDAPYFMEGFTDDGGCTEGAGYWEFGFGWFLRMAAGVYTFTGGALDFFALLPKARRILRYPRVGCLGNGMNVPISDCPTEWYLPSAIATLANRFDAMPELYGMARLDAAGRFADHTLEALLWTDPDARHAPYTVARDEYFPQLGQALATRGSLTLAAKAGHNAEIHNHNDVGSFVLLRGRTLFLTDPGGPIYRRDTFGPDRYAILFCGSQGHGVPVVDGHVQSDGRAYEGTLTVASGAEASEGGDAVMTVEFAGAYDVPSLRSLTRTLRLAGDGGGLTVEDGFVFSEGPRPVREHFVTWLDARVSADGRSVTLPSGGADGTMVLRAESAGTFSLEVLTEDCARDGKAVMGVLRRLAFTPAPDASSTAEGVLTTRFRLEMEP